MKRIQLLLAAVISIAATLVWAEESKDTSDIYNRGVMHLNKDQFDGALPYFQQVIRMKPNHTRALYNLGVIYLNKGQYDLALPYFERVVLLERDNQRALYNLGVIHMNQNRWDQALHRFEQVVRLEPGNARALYNLGVIQMKEGEYEKAAPYFERVISLDPDSARALYNLGIVRMRLGDYGRAADVLAEAARLNPDTELYALTTSLAVISSREPPVAKGAEELSAALGEASTTSLEGQHQADVARSVADFKGDLKDNYPSFDSEAFKCRSDLQRCKEFGYGYLDCELTMIACVVNSVLQ